MELVARLDEYGKPAWIALMVLGFIIFWPVGLAILAYMIWSGRMLCGKFGRGPGRWHETEEGREQRRGRRRWRGRNRRRSESSGNVAFDEYREETLRRLEEEQEEFVSFLERLRHAKDKAEFDQFMADRRRAAAAPDDGPEGSDEPTGEGRGYPRAPDGPTPYPAG